MIENAETKADTLFRQLEEKLITLLTERDKLIRGNQQLTVENQALKSAKETHEKKLHDLVSLIESISSPEENQDNFSPSLAAIKPLMAQG